MKDEVLERKQNVMIPLEEEGQKRKKGQRFVKRIWTEQHQGHKGRVNFQEDRPSQEGTKGFNEIDKVVTE